MCRAEVIASGVVEFAALVITFGFRLLASREAREASLDGRFVTLGIVITIPSHSLGEDGEKYFRKSLALECQALITFQGNASLA